MWETIWIRADCSNIIFNRIQVKDGAVVSWVANVQTLFLQQWCSLRSFELNWKGNLGSFKAPYSVLFSSPYKSLQLLLCSLTCVLINTNMLMTLNFSSLFYSSASANLHTLEAALTVLSHWFSINWLDREPVNPDKSDAILLGTHLSKALHPIFCISMWLDQLYTSLTQSNSLASL